MQGHLSRVSTLAHPTRFPASSKRLFTRTSFVRVVAKRMVIVHAEQKYVICPYSIHTCCEVIGKSGIIDVCFPNSKALGVFCHSKDFGADRSKRRSRFRSRFRSKFRTRFRRRFRSRSRSRFRSRLRSRFRRRFRTRLRRRFRSFSFLDMTRHQKVGQASA